MKMKDKRKNFMIRLPESLLTQMRDINGKIDISWGRICEEAIRVYIDKVAMPLCQFSESENVSDGDEVCVVPGHFYYIHDNEGCWRYPNLEFQPEVYLKSWFDANSDAFAVEFGGEIYFLAPAFYRQLLSLNLIKNDDVIPVVCDEAKERFFASIDLEFDQKYKEKRRKKRELEYEQHWRDLEGLDENGSGNGLVSVN